MKDCLLRLLTGMDFMNVMTWASNDRELERFEEKQKATLERNKLSKTQCLCRNNDENLKLGQDSDPSDRNSSAVFGGQKSAQVSSYLRGDWLHSIGECHTIACPTPISDIKMRLKQPNTYCRCCAKQSHCKKDFFSSTDFSLSFLVSRRIEKFLKPKKIVSHCQTHTLNKCKHLKSNILPQLALYQTLLIIFLILLLQSSTVCARKHRRSNIFLSEFDTSTSHRASRFNQPFQLGRPTKRLRSRWLYPSVVNLASHARITSNATCGLNGPAKYCKLVEHVDRRWSRGGKQCSMCNSQSILSSERHSIENAIDGRGDSWWQSPTIEQGHRYHWVTITLDLKQVFQVAYVIIKAANSPRPGNWVLEKSIDGNVWEPWQYFAITDSECFKTYGLPPARFGAPKYRYDAEVMCTSYFSKLNPLENGEIHVSLINGRPSAESPSPELVAFTSARYVRIRLQKVRTLHGDLMTRTYRFPGYADPLVTRRVPLQMPVTGKIVERHESQQN